ncbi:MAG: isopentenyl-diphosphate Delta-isomerase [Flavobacteriales bacterium]|nr:isopentenyl-diphosphate Delta-isomerase [Flavobacteriales bacterium]
MMEEVILVDENDHEIGTMEKMEAHKAKHLHRAFSIFLFNSKHQLLLQKRASSKYHSPNLWTNACCSHPRPNETVIDAAQRRLMEELNCAVPLHEEFSFVYECEFENGLYEHEFDHVLFGKVETLPEPNPEEASSCKFASFQEVEQLLKSYPDQFTFWFKVAFKKVRDRYYEKLTQ